MSALPRPDLPAGHHRDLNDALHELHHRAGWPSLRTLARETGVSHTTVSKAFSSPALPSWGTLELLVEAMAGDTHEFHDLWLAASSPIDSTRSPLPRIAGRKAELAAVRRHLESGAGLLLVTGEAGIGKTTLVTAAAEATNVFVAIGHCRPLSTPVPLLPVADLLRDTRVIDSGAWFTDALGACPAYVAEALSQILPELNVPATTTVSAEFARQRLLLAVRTVLAALHKERPLALLVEDLPWADDTTLDVVELLAVGEAPFPIVGTWRTDDPGADHDQWRARMARSAASLHLDQLTSEETTDQLTLLTGHSPDADLVKEIFRRSLGQPLFTEQLATHAATGDHFLPELLVDVLSRRLDALPESTWQTARALAVADRPLTVSQLVHIAAQSNDILFELRTLGARRLISILSGPEVRLRHPLIGEAIRHRLLPDEALDVHRRIARVLAELADPPAAEIADHWRSSGDSDHEIVWRVRAARAAQGVFAGADAAAQWRRVLDLWPDQVEVLGDPAVRKPEVLLAAMDALELTGDGDACIELARRGLLAAPGWQPSDRAELLWRAGMYRGVFEGLGTTGLDLIQSALDLYRGLPPSMGLVEALDLKATELRFLGRLEESATALGEAIDAAHRLGEAGLERGLLATIAWQDAVAGRMDLALTRIETVASMKTATPDPLRDIRVSLFHTDILLMACRPAEEIVAAAHDGLSAITEWEIGATESDVLIGNVALAWLRSGAVTRAVEVVGPALEQPAIWAKPITDLLSVNVNVCRGRLDDARARAAEALDHGFPALMELAWSECDVWDGNPAAAFDRAINAFDSLLGARNPGDAGSALALVARAAADLGTTPGTGRERRAEIMGRLTSLHDSLAYDPFAETAVPADRHAAPTWQAEVARLAGQDALELWVRAATEWDSVSRPHDAAYCRWRAAQVALREGQGTQAARLLKRAATDAREHVPLSEAIARTRGSS